MFSFVKLNEPEVRVRLNLFCFHWAGGSGMAYKPLSTYLQSHGIAVYGITLPGRNGRNTNTMFRRFPELVKALLPEFVEYHSRYVIGELPLIFFGHSFGGLLAYELKKAITVEDYPRIVIDRVIVSAVRCPMDLTEQNKELNQRRHFQMSDTELMAYITSIGGVPPGVDPEIVEFMLPTIRGDYEAIETYDMEHFGPLVINSPLTLIEAKKDASLSSSLMARWKFLTSEEYNVIEIAHGGHFYLTDAATRDEFYVLLLEECEKHCVPSPSSCAIS